VQACTQVDDANLAMQHGKSQLSVAMCNHVELDVIGGIDVMLDHTVKLDGLVRRCLDVCTNFLN